MNTADTQDTPVKLAPDTVVRKYPSTRDSFVNGCWRWIEGKRKDDNARDLWRVHDRLYDLTNFISKHPGGEFWLEITKGTDITEAFESHHITPKASQLLNNFYVSDAHNLLEPRNYFFTYNKNGFYQTLKRRVAAKLKTVDTSVTWKSRMIHDVNLFALFIAAIMMNRSENQVTFLIWSLISAQCIAWSANFSHNFMHQADNWRMYTANLSLITWRDYRVFHVLSHHMYPNTYSDYEVSTYEPYYKWIPTQKKTWFYKVFAFLITPVLYVSLFHNIWRYRVQGYIWAKEKVFHWDELLMLTLPIAMIVFGKQTVTLAYLGEVYTKWGYLSITGEFLFGSVFFNRGHHGTDQTHQNDDIKSLDFGEFQLSTTVDRVEANRNAFTSLAYFGDQVLHHLFPSIDHSLLPQLKETLVKTCKEFDIDLHPPTTMLKATFGQFKQLYRSEIIKAS